MCIEVNKMNIKSTTICLFLSLLLILCFISPAFGEEDIRKSASFTEEQVNELLSRAVPTQPEALKRFAADEKNTLSVSGSIPYLEGEAAYDWWLTISSVAESMYKDRVFEKYLYANGGPIVGYGPMTDGFIQISIHDEMTGRLSSQDVRNMNQIVEKYAIAEGIKDVPVVMVYSSINGNDTRLVQGGHVAATPGRSPGTFAFAVRQNNNSNARGIITVAHLIDFDVRRDVHVNDTSSGTRLGRAAAVRNNIDAIYVPYSNVSSMMYVGYDPLIPASQDRTQIKVYMGIDAAYGSILSRYGSNTGNTQGYLKGFEYDRVWAPPNATVIRTFDKVGYMNASQGHLVSQFGDSGGPIYCGMTVTTSTGQSYQALVLGMTFGVGGLNGEPVTLFVPFREIQDKFNVTILT
jgi:hypothetical protein